MKSPFTFLTPGKLEDDDLELVLVGKHPADATRKRSPWYEFEMRRPGKRTKLGRIRFRVDSARRLRLPGHLGFEVNKRHRGHRYAARSCRLLLPLAHAHGLPSLWITCDPKNMASRRSCELAGGKSVQTVRIPKRHEMYAKDRRSVCRYRIDVKKEMSNNGIQTAAPVPLALRRKWGQLSLIRCNDIKFHKEGL